MALYLIGDLQGCDSALARLLERVAFSPSRDTLYFLGDLVNRGAQSDAVLRRLQGYGDAAHCLLGNHDLHLLAVAQGVRPAGRKDTLQTLLQAKDCAPLLDWLRQQSLALQLPLGNTSLLMVHAGVQPSWTAAQTMALAAEVEQVLRSGDAAAFFQSMYGDSPNTWSEQLQGMERLRVVVNSLTRLRFCTAEGAMEFASKDSAGTAPAGYMPWFDVPQRQTAANIVAFGHWSTLRWPDRADIWPLDGGCVWGGALTAMRITGSGPAGKPLQHWHAERIQVPCEAAQKPGE
jgi:bis(5'-nucleosyl)-tetraphosphatase (symmetrical)